MLKFSDECAATEAKLQSQYQKLFRSFNKCFSTYKKNSVLVQNLLFLSAGIFQTHIFEIKFLDFCTGIRLTRPADDGKKAGLLFPSKKRKCLFLTSKEDGGLDMNANKFC